MNYKFNAVIKEDCPNGYKIWIPKRISDTFPDNMWVVKEVTIRYPNEEQPQILSHHSISKSGRRYIPIYKSEVSCKYEDKGEAEITIYPDGIEGDVLE